MHSAMPQPLMSIQCLSRMFSTFKNYKNQCMLSKLVMGLPYLEKGNKLLFSFLFNLTMFFILKLNANMSDYDINLLILNMLAIQTDVRFPKHLVKSSYLTHPPTTMFSQPIKFGDKQFFPSFNCGANFALNHFHLAIWPTNQFSPKKLFRPCILKGLI